MTSRAYLAAVTATLTLLGAQTGENRGDAATSPVPSSAPLEMTGSEILARLLAARQGLHSYSVPIHFNLTVHKGPSVSAQLDAVRYFQSPDRELLAMNSMPSFAGKFRYIYSGLGTPETWPSSYDVTRVAGDPESATYELKCVPRTTTGVSYMLWDVTRDTYAPVAAHVFYTNTGRVDLQFENAQSGGYLLPLTETIDIAFPDYKVHAVGHYGTYSINRPIPDSVWQTSPAPLPT